MSRLLTFISTMGPALAILFVVASSSTASATTYDLTLTQSYGNYGNGSGTITFGETLRNGTNEPFTGDDEITITIGGLTFGPVTLFTDTADVTNGQVTGIAVGNLPSYFDGSYFTKLELADGQYNSYSITYDNIQIAGGNYSLSLPAPPPTVTPLPGALPLFAAGFALMGLFFRLRGRKESPITT